jgi:hypothetical protein
MQIEEAVLPKIARVYKQRYDRMATSEYIRELNEYADSVLHDSIKGLEWRGLLEWEHRHLKYTKGELPEPRAELPIEILKQAQGRCGEFALLYNGLLLANRYNTRIILDCSTLHDRSRKTAGDHVWNEILLEGFWTHVDPTERRINQPSMYVLDWKKDVNLVYAITRERVLDITELYSDSERKSRQRKQASI